MYVDATLGYAGDSKEILKRIKKGCLVSFDQDKEACEYSDNVLKDIGGNYKIFNTNFSNMVECLESIGIKEVNGIIFDLGFSSPQVDDAKRGFSFMQDGPLDMRMSGKGITAKEVIDRYSEEDLAKVFFEYGEEKMSRVIARRIVSNKSKINTTMDLVDTIKDAVGANYFYKHHPERKIFQALRIEVNNELKVLEDILPKAIKLLKKGGRMSVITFHSKEDRIVKQIFKKYSEVDEMLKGERVIPDEYKPLIKLVNKKPIVASKKELDENSRSASAKLRIIERI